MGYERVVVNNQSGVDNEIMIIVYYIYIDLLLVQYKNIQNS